MKKAVSFLLAAIIIAVQLSVGLSVLPLKADATEIDYKCGDNATWYLDTDGVLTISGTGDMYDSVRPWKSYASTIKSVVVEEGITGIGTYSLYDCSSAKKIYIASTVEYLSPYAFPSNATEIIFAENSVLSNVYLKTLTETQWYKNQPADEPLYLGRCLLGMPEGSTATSLEVKEGTYAINEYAFHESTITDFTFPESLTAIGRYAFTDSAWLEAQPDGPVYAGNVFLTYKGYLPIEEVDYEIPEGVVGIAGMAFYDNTRLNTIKIPSSVEYIGEYAFLSAYNLYDIDFHENSKLRCLSSGVFQGCSKLAVIELPESLESIGEYCFVSTGLTRLHIPKNVKVIHIHHFSRQSMIEAYSVDEDNPFYCNDEAGALYTKDMKILIAFPRESALTEYTVNQNCEIIRENAFSSSGLETINLNYGLEKIEIEAFEFSKSNVYVSATVTTVNSYALMNFKGTVYCYENSAMHEAAVKRSVSFVLLDNAVDTSNITQLISSAESIDRSLYTEESLAELDEALSVVDLESTGLTQEQIVEWETAIETAIKNLDYLPADYSSVEEIKSRADEIDRTLYTPESLAELDEALAAVDYELTIDKQSQVAEWVSAIETAIENLDYLPADYSSVEEAKNRAEEIDRTLYTPESLAELDEALAAVDYDLTIDKQSQVAEWVSAIETAIENLDYLPADYSAVEEAKNRAKEIDRTLYTSESLAELDEALAAVDYELTIDKQSQVAEWVSAIETAIENLDYLPADYSAVEEAKNRAKAIDRTLYTPESLAELDEALAAVDYDLTIDKQSQVAEWETAIETAIENLDYLPADYSAVEAELNKVNVLDRRYYSEISLLALENAVNSIDYNLNITEQDQVNEYAKAVADALAKLEYASIVLRHEPCGIIVSATTKEIKPDTVLTAQEVDPSNYEGTNFAVGGSIRSLHFYDINLVLKGEKVQPEGTVTVKIKLADGVNPAKCKVYHVTEDIVNPLVRFASTIDGNYIVFETTHFSEFAVIEVETVLDSIEITQQPDKTDYVAGENLETKGMKVVAKFSDGTSKEISDYTVGMVNLNTAGKHKVTVYYTFGSITKTAEFEVNVTAKEIKAEITESGKPTDSVNKKLGLFSFYSKAAIQLECDVKNAEGCTLRWSSDNSKVMVDENGRVTCKGLFGAKKANITLEVVDGSGKVVASDTVRVVFYKLSFQLSNAVAQAIRFFREDY